MPTIRTQQFVNRIADRAARSLRPLSRALVPALSAAAAECLSVAEAFAAKAEECARDGSLTQAGQAKALAGALPTFLKTFSRARGSIDKARKALQERREAMKIAPVDSTNIVAALERQEIRAWLSDLDANAAAAIARTTDDKRVLDAIISMPPALSGIVGHGAEAVIADVKARHLALTHGDEIADLDDAQVVVAEAVAAAQVARDEMQRTAGLDDRQFAQILSPIERKIGAPWLIKQPDGSVVVVKPGQATYPPATADELTEGVFYATAAEYYAAQGAAKGNGHAGAGVMS